MLEKKSRNNYVPTFQTYLTNGTDAFNPSDDSDDSFKAQSSFFTLIIETFPIFERPTKIIGKLNTGSRTIFATQGFKI